MIPQLSLHRLVCSYSLSNSPMGLFALSPFSLKWEAQLGFPLLSFFAGPRKSGSARISYTMCKNGFWTSFVVQCLQILSLIVLKVSLTFLVYTNLKFCRGKTCRFGNIINPLHSSFVKSDLICRIKQHLYKDEGS